MNQISPEQVLSQIRSMSQTLQAPSAPAMPSVEQPGRSEFGSLLKTTLQSVNSAQQASAELKLGIQRGDIDKTLPEVMIAAQKADVSFKAVTEVRNKLITAYQDVMNMPV